MLVVAIVLISLALVFYTIGVWAEKIQGTLKKWHLGMFCLGLVFDTTGTITMSKIAAENGSASPFHAITGGLALILMLVHAIWAVVVLAKNNQKSMKQFHKFSVIVWVIWLVPYLSGMIYSMMNI